MASANVAEKKLHIPNQYAGQLIGKNRSRLQEIESLFADSDLTAQVVREEDRTYFVLSALHQKAVDRCEKLIELMKQEINTSGQLSRYSVANHYKRLATDSQAGRLNTKRDGRPNQPHPPSPFARNIQTASNTNTDREGHSASSSRNDRNDKTDSTQSFSDLGQVEVIIPKRHHGKIIGKGGANLKAITAKYSVRIVLEENVARITPLHRNADCQGARKELEALLDCKIHCPFVNGSWLHTTRCFITLQNMQQDEWKYVKFFRSDLEDEYVARKINDIKSQYPNVKIVFEDNVAKISTFRSINNDHDSNKRIKEAVAAELQNMSVYKLEREKRQRERLCEARKARLDDICRKSGCNPPFYHRQPCEQWEERKRNIEWEAKKVKLDDICRKSGCIPPFYHRHPCERETNMAMFNESLR